MTISQKIKQGIEFITFQCKWMLLPFNIGLVVGLAIFLCRFCMSEYDLLHDFLHLTEEDVVLALLKLVDATMTAALVVMIIRGTHRSSIDKKAHDGDQERVSSGTLKIKMGSSLIVICFINLLQSYYKTGELNWNVLGMKASIFFMFVLGTLALTYIDSHTHHDEPKQDVAPAKTPEATKH
jgi:uncharacterized protein (TIGR00645 family)